MTAFDRFDRVFEDVLADLAQPSYPDYIDDVLTRATTGSQRPAWTFPERWLPMSTLARPASLAPGLPWRNVGLLAMLALLAAALLAVAIGTQRRLAPPYGPAANGQILYMVDGDIYSRAGIDSPPRLVVGGDELDVYPLFARDGSKFAFVRIDREETETEPEISRVFVADSDGSNARAVFGPTTLIDVAWSPDSSELAILEDVRGATRLSIVTTATGSATVVPFEGQIIGRVLWRPPDGRELVFLAEVEGRRSIYVAAEDGSSPRSLTGGRQIPVTSNMALTPDGKSLYYMNMAGTFDIRVISIDTGDLRVFGGSLPPLSPGPVHAGNVQVSADGSKVVFGRYWDGENEENLINHQLWMASTAGDGADGIAISAVIRSQGGMDPFVVLLSPDGSQVLVHHRGTTDTWVTDFPGGSQRTVDWGSFDDTDWQRMAP